MTEDNDNIGNVSGQMFSDTNNNMDICPKCGSLVEMRAGRRKTDALGNQYFEKSYFCTHCKQEVGGR